MTAIDHFEQHLHVYAGGTVNAVSGGDLNVHDRPPGYHIGTLELGAAPVPADARWHPSRLLATAHQLVSFQGRRDELRRLSVWRDRPDEFGAVLIHGPGGQGKTRLAQKFAELSGAAGWAVVEARPDPLRLSNHRLASEVPLGVAGRVVVIDYAERWPPDLLRALLSDARLHAGRNRLVLLARPAGNWWQRVRRFLHAGFRVNAQRLSLSPLPVGSAEQALLFAAARDAFADRLQVRGVQGLATPPGLSADATPLDLQMAALAAVYAVHRSERAPADPTALSAYLLDREREHWVELHERAGLPTRAETMARAVYLASLTGPLRYEAAGVLATATGLAAAGQEVQQLLDDHSVSYPAFGRWVLAPLQPDRLAEDFVALAACGLAGDEEPDPWTDDQLAKILQTLVESAPDRVPAMLLLTVLIGQRWEAYSRTQLGPLLRAYPAMFITGGPTLLNALAEIRDLDASILSVLEEEMPVSGPPEVMHPLATLTGRLLVRLRRAAVSPDALGPLKFRLARRLVHAQRFQAALPLLEGPGGPAGLAEAIRLGYRARAYDGVGRRPEALSTARKAVNLCFGARRSPAPAAETAELLELYGRLLHDTDQHIEAANWQSRACSVWRLLSDGQASYRPEYAGSLSTLSEYQRSAGRKRPALEAAEEAVRLWQSVDAVTPGEYRTRLFEAQQMIARSPVASLPGRLEAGAVAGQGFWDLWRGDFTLAPRTVSALRTWSGVLNDAGRHGEAVAWSRRAWRLARVLARRDDGYAQLSAAASMTFAASCLAARRRLEEGLAAARDSYAFYRKMRDYVRRDDAERTVAGILIALGRQFEADEVLGRSRRATPLYEGSFERAARVSRRVEPEEARPCRVCGGTGIERRIVDGAASGNWACHACGGRG